MEKQSEVDGSQFSRLPPPAPGRDTSLPNTLLHSQAKCFYPLRNPPSLWPCAGWMLDHFAFDTSPSVTSLKSKLDVAAKGIAERPPLCWMHLLISPNLLDAAVKCGMLDRGRACWIVLLPWAVVPPGCSNLLGRAEDGWELLYVGCNLLQALLLCASIERRGSRWTESAGPCWTRGGLLDAAACWTNTGRR
ncbi:hypothetical protein LR48_Vigan04g051400 [Vigna angularis]|uniref:Uncharacterized protein n=1 Tax=Phaseolus angularis TaxID=3914 RepID=A0A0L9UC78_PHAAN|nr:hypothetical protein LR48_Vigan04g051400 [Vigna angularis]